MREVAGVHRELFEEQADLYGENVRVKVERCLRVTDREAEAAARERVRFAERFAAACEGVDLLVTPTLPFVAPPDTVEDLDVREAMISLTYPLSVVGWPALALPCGPAEDGLPASVQIAGRPGEDALVLAAGAALETALASPI
jgi:aspartyl-tRNA(Asn)/glutamyl-tRNA(Gln) amidotransferase subunit A